MNIEALFNMHINMIEEEYNKTVYMYNAFLRYADMNKCPFGKYKDAKYSKIPKSYIKWYHNNLKSDKFNNSVMDNLYKHYFCQ
jgi:uncharacterized protein (DUF3820 family)